MTVVYKYKGLWSFSYEDRLRIIRVIMITNGFWAVLLPKFNIFIAEDNAQGVSQLENVFFWKSVLYGEG